MKKALFLMLVLWISGGVFAQDFPDIDLPLPEDSTQLHVRTTGFPEMKELWFHRFPGAPLLRQPVRVDGTRYEIRMEEHGLAYPTLFDWNGDGKPDLLVGEFLTGQSRIKVYLNTGSKKNPRFTGEWFYATDVNGDVISNYEWCCIGIHPQIVDVNGDGYMDIVSGQYYPGEISWWQGTKDGFLPRKMIKQLGYQVGKKFVMGEDPVWSPEAWEYWNYSSARLADFNGDGLLDLFVAGTGGYRVALNVGTKENPEFGRREFLFHTDGTILHTRREPGICIATGENFNAVNACAGSSHCYLNPVDWDGDGVLDIIATDGYTGEGEAGVYFLRGVVTDDGLRFEQAQPLFLAKDGSKALPGCNPHIQVVDYNGDGVPDIIMGLSIPTINGFEGATDLYWRWVSDMGIESPGKDTGESLKYYGGLEKIKAQLKEQPMMKSMLIGKLDDWKYITLRHRGYVFVFPGQRNKEKALAIPMKAAKREFVYDRPPEKKMEYKIERKPVSCDAKVRKSETGLNLTVYMQTSGTWHLYTPSEANSNQPVHIDIELPEGWQKDGALQTPPTILSGGSEIYDGKRLDFEQNIKPLAGQKGTFEIKVKVSWQTCNESTCLPPDEKEMILNVTL